MSAHAKKSIQPSRKSGPPTASCAKCRAAQISVATKMLDDISKKSLFGIARRTFLEFEMMDAISPHTPKAADGTELLAQRAEAALIDALRTGALRSGQFLSIPQLVEQLNQPIAAVRDAVKHAGGMGLLETFPKRGLQVMEARPEIIRDCLNFRMMLDQEGARRLIASGGNLDLTDLREAHERMRDLTDDGPDSGLSARAIVTDLSLHDFLATGLNNTLAAEAYAANRIRIAIIQNVRPFLFDRIRSAMAEHLAILDGLDRRDAAATVDAIKAHCEQTLRWWGVT